MDDFGAPMNQMKCLLLGDSGVASFPTIISLQHLNYYSSHEAGTFTRHVK